MDQSSSSRSARLPVREKIAWGLGGFSDQVAANGLNSLFVPIYNVGFGMSSVLIGWAAAIPRLIDTLSHPVMGKYLGQQPEPLRTALSVCLRGCLPHGARVWALLHGFAVSGERCTLRLCLRLGRGQHNLHRNGYSRAVGVDCGGRLTRPAALAGAVAHPMPPRGMITHRRPGPEETPRCFPVSFEALCRRSRG